eukprot:6743837-Prymnesium_polylepis.3
MCTVAAPRAGTCASRLALLCETHSGQCLVSAGIRGSFSAVETFHARRTRYRPGRAAASVQLLTPFFRRRRPSRSMY